MLIDVTSLLPEEISDEVAFHIVNFFVELTAHIESQYYPQLKRYTENNSPPNVFTYNSSD